MTDILIAFSAIAFGLLVVAAFRVLELERTVSDLSEELSDAEKRIEFFKMITAGKGVKK